MHVLPSSHFLPDSTTAGFFYFFFPRSIKFMRAHTCACSRVGVCPAQLRERRWEAGGGNNEFMRSSINLSLHGMKAGLALVFNVHSSEKTRRFCVTRKLVDKSGIQRETDLIDGGARAVERNSAKHTLSTHTHTHRCKDNPPTTHRPPPHPHILTHHTSEVVAKAQHERIDWSPPLITVGTHRLDWPALFRMFSHRLPGSLITPRPCHTPLILFN